LYRANRTTLANSGQPIHMNQPTDVMDIGEAMAKTHYSTVEGVMGFCRAIDSGIHGRIHVLVGTSQNMGAVPYAANDPLFWLHHA
ncbi:tyrosinase family protein, partial [Acinetobacter baumannii]